MTINIARPQATRGTPRQRWRHRNSFRSWLLLLAAMLGMAFVPTAHPGPGIGAGELQGGATIAHAGTVLQLATPPETLSQPTGSAPTVAKDRNPASSLAICGTGHAHDGTVARQTQVHCHGLAAIKRCRLLFPFHGFW